MSRPLVPAPRAARRPLLGRVPVALWVVLGVVVAHVLFFWLVADKHYLPETRHIPPPPPVNFGAREQTSLDPATGETVTEQEFVVSTHLATPKPSPRASVRPPP